MQLKVWGRGREQGGVSPRGGTGETGRARDDLSQT